MSSEAVVVKQLLVVTRALRVAEDELRPDTEHLRGEIKDLLEGTICLFEKLNGDRTLRELQEMLYGEPVTG
jgi:hypothetical protein